MSPLRRFGTPSRAANSRPYQKPEDSGKTPEKVAKGAVDFILNQDPALRSPDENATRYDSTFPRSRCTSSTLDLPYIKDENFGTLSIPLHYEGSPQQLQETYARFQEPQEAEVDSPGMPTRVQWQAIVETYLSNLHERKRDKALINRTMHNMIFETLSNPEATRVGSPQFRFWARKMFDLVQTPDGIVITHGNRPVAVKEHMYEILCMCHAESDHAGRDKTCKVLRNYYTWIPKELVANFVKACPTCAKKRTFDALYIDTTRIGQLIIPRRVSGCMTTPSTLTNSSASSSAISLTGPLVSGGPNDVNNFKEPYASGDMYLVDGQQPKSVPTPLAQLTLRPSHLSEFNALGLHASHHQDKPGNEGLTLPPFNGPEVSSPEGGTNVTKEMAGAPPRLDEASNSGLPPLMRYLTKDGALVHDITFNQQAGGGGLPIDPSLLGNIHRLHSGSAGPTFPPTPLLTVGILNEPTTSDESAFHWHRANADVPTSVSPNSQYTLSPYSPSPAFFSPIPVKAEEKSPILEFPPESPVPITMKEESN